MRVAAGKLDSRWKLPAKWYRVDLPTDRPLVTVLMLDSNKPLLGEQQWRNQLDWIEQELSKPRTAAWTICCAHHPLYSNGNQYEALYEAEGSDAVLAMMNWGYE